MPLQPTGVPSRAGIQAAIDEAVANHASTTDTASLHYDSGWSNLPVAAAGGTGVARIRRVGKTVQIEFATSGASIATGSTATTIVAAGGIPAGMRPGTTVYSLGNSGGAIPQSFIVGTNGSIAVNHQHTATVTVVRSVATYIIA